MITNHNQKNQEFHSYIKTKQAILKQISGSKKYRNILHTYNLYEYVILRKIICVFLLKFKMYRCPALNKKNYGDVQGPHKGGFGGP